MGSACTSTTKSESSLPEWLTGPAADTIGRSVTESFKPFTPYGGELTAGLTPAQQQAIAVARGSQGNWAGQLNAAQGDLAHSRALPGAMDAGSPYLYSAADASSVAAGSPLINRAANTSAYGAASSLIGKGTGAGGTEAASPFLSAASQTAPGAISSYMSPYTSGVVDEIARLGSRNLTENIIPNINDTFIGSGQFGSDRNAATIGNSIRDASRDIAGKQSEALERGYGTAGTLFQADQSRLAGLAGTAGNLAEAGAGRSLTGASLVGNLVGSDASRALEAGRSLGTLTNADAGRTLDAGRSLGSLADADRTGALSQARTGASLSAQQQQQNLADVNGLLGAGGVQQQTQQAGNASALQEWLRQQNFGKDQLSWLSSIIRGTPAPQTQTQSAQSSPFGVAAGIGSLLAGIKWKEGGRVSSGGALASFKPSTRMRTGGVPPEGETEEERLYRESREGLESAEPIGAYVEPEPSPDDYKGIPGARALPHDGSEPKVQPLGALASVAPRPAGKGALAEYREQLFKDATDDTDIKKAMADVDALQKSALDRPKKEKGWLDSPFTQAGLAILAAPPGTSGISAIGQGFLTASKNRQAERRIDAAEEKEDRITILKSAQQRLSNLFDTRRDKRSAINTLLANDASMANVTEQTRRRAQAAADAADARIEAARERGATQRQIAQMALEGRRDVARIISASQERRSSAANESREAVADTQAGSRERIAEEKAAIEREKLDPPMVRELRGLGLDPRKPDDVGIFRALKSKTGAESGKSFAPHQITKLRNIIADPSAPDEDKAAAERLIGNLGNREMTPAQRADLDARVNDQVDKEVSAFQKDNKFPTPEAMQAWRVTRAKEIRDARMKFAEPPKPTLPSGASAPPAPAATVGAEAPAPVPAPAAAPPPAAAKPAPAKPDLKPRIPEGEATKQRDLIALGSPLVKDVDWLIERIQNAPHGGWKTGFGGALQRAYNGTIGQAGDQNLSPADTEIMTRMRSVKPSLQSMFKVDSNQSKAEREDNDAWLETQGWFQSKGDVVARLNEMKRKLEGRVSVARGRLGEEQPKDPPKTPQQRGAAIYASGKRPEGVGADWKVAHDKKLNLMLWISPDGSKRVPAE